MIKETNDINLINLFLNEFNVSIKEAGEFSKYIIYYLENEPIAFMDYDLIYDRVELSYIFVKEEYRKNNIATKLLNYLEDISSINKCINITLEVNVSNIPALSFYKKNGFKVVSIREKYYGNDDGYLMLKEMI